MLLNERGEGDPNRAAVPILKGEEFFGGGLDFIENQIALVETFADQAAIA